MHDDIIVSGVTRGKQGVGADRPGWHPPGRWHPSEMNKSDSDELMSKKVVSVFFQEKIGVTPSVAAPGDTNPSDAND